MKVLFLKKKSIAPAVCLCLFFTLLSIGTRVADVSAVVINKKLPIYSVQTDENKLAISFDAAWGADKTRDVMAVCESYNVKATFFLVGFWIDKYPEMVKEIYNRGFEIGIHSSTHPDMTKLSKSKIREELYNNMVQIKELTGFTPRLFRPPYGYYNNNLIDVCEDLGLSCIEWSVDSLDWKGLSASEIAGRVTSKSNNGSIVLFHNNSDNIISGLKMVLEYYRLNNMKVVPIGEMIYYGSFSIDHQGVQIKK